MSARVRAVVLAAGKGTRMKSARPKMLHRLCGRSLLWYVLRALADAGVDGVAIVTSGDIDERVWGLATDAGFAGAQTVRQEPQLGTGHAVQVALARRQRARDGHRPYALALVIRPGGSGRRARAAHRRSARCDG